MPTFNRQAMKKHLLNGILFLIISTFLSCEYEFSDDHYRHIEPPTNINVGIELAGHNPDEIIYIYAPTALRYTLYGTNHIHSIEFSLDGNTTDYYGSGEYYVSPNEFDDQIHILKVKVKINVNTGTIAEAIAGALYEGEIEYKLKYVKSDFNLNIQQRQNSEKYLELFWDKPQVEKLNVDRYEIYDGYHSNPVQVITNPDQTSYLDKDYAYGNKTFRIKTYFEDNKIGPWEQSYTIQYEPLKQEDILIEVTGTDVYLKWNNPNTYPCKYILTGSYYSMINLEIEDANEVTFPRTSFPSVIDKHYYSLYILPRDADSENKVYYHSIEIPYSYADKRMDNVSNHFISDIKNKMLYGYTNDELYVYNPMSMEKIKTIPFAGHLSGVWDMKISSSTGYIALSYFDGKTRIYKDNTFSTVISEFVNNSSGFYLMENDKLIIGKNDNFDVFDIATGNLLYTIPVNHSNESSFTLSEGGKYMAYKSGYEVKIYELNNTSYSLKYSYSGQNDYPVAFSHLNKSHLFIRNNYKTKILDIEITEFKNLDGVPASFDMFTGNIIFSDSDYWSSTKYAVYNSNYEKIYEMKNSNMYSQNVYLINNYLIYNGYYLDLSKALKK